MCNMTLNSDEKIIKSKARVRDQGEVFTPISTVNLMLDMLGDPIIDTTKTVLEPTCGNGNFLVEILKRRLSNISKRKKTSVREYEVLVALSRIYGIDIMHDNIREARSRLMSVVSDYFSSTRNSAEFLAAATVIISRNVIQGDTLKHKSSIIILEWIPLYEQKGFEINPHTLAQIENDLKDVVTAYSIAEISDKVDEIFSPKQVSSKSKSIKSKKTSKQSELLFDIAGGTV